MDSSAPAQVVNVFDRTSGVNTYTSELGTPGYSDANWVGTSPTPFQALTLSYFGLTAAAGNEAFLSAGNEWEGFGLRKNLGATVAARTYVVSFSIASYAFNPVDPSNFVILNIGAPGGTTVWTATPVIANQRTWYRWEGRYTPTPAEVGQPFVFEMRFGRTGRKDIAIDGPIALGAEALTIDMVDPVPSLLSGAVVNNLPCALSTGGRDVRGVSADGVAQVVVRVHTAAVNDSITLSLSNPAGGDAGGLMPVGGGPPSASLSVTATCSDPDGSGGLAFALYRAPVDFAGTVAQLTHNARTVQLSASAASGAQVQVTIGVVRPPVVLVHGYGTNSDSTWKDFEPFDSANSSLVRTYRADYGGSLGLFSFVETTTPATAPTRTPDIRRSHLGFSWNQPDVASQVRSFIAEYRESDNALSAPIAAVQADVVAHSMGGLVVRYWTAQRKAFLAPETFGQGFVHKLITLGTPHFGSPQAIVTLDPTGAVCSRANGAAVERFAFSEATILKLVPGANIYATVPGAVGELSGDGVGSYLSSALEETVAKAWPVPTAMLGGDVTPVLPNLEFNPFAWGLRLGCSGDVLADRYTPNLFSTIFDSSIRPGNVVGNAVPTASDGSVPLTSAFRDPSFTVCSGPLCAAGAAHGANTALFFLPSYSHLLDRSRTLSLMVEGFLNLPTNDARWKR